MAESPLGPSPDDSLITDALLMDETSAKQFVDEAFQKWIQPEITRRQLAGTVEDSFSPRSFQILFYPDDRPTVIRLGTEVKARAQVKPTDAARGKIQSGEKKLGDPIYLDEIERIILTELGEEDDPDCAHITHVVIEGLGPFLSFDEVYNKGYAQRNFESACSFLEVAQWAMANGHTGPFWDSAFSALELFAKAELLLLTTSELRGTVRHGTVWRLMDQQAELHNIDPSYPTLRSDLYGMRLHGRYLRPIAGESLDAGNVLDRLRRLKTVCKSNLNRARNLAN